MALKYDRPIDATAESKARLRQVDLAQNDRLQAIIEGLRAAQSEKRT